MNQAPKHTSLSVSQRRFYKIQYVNPAEKFRLNSHSGEKNIFVSPNQKVTFSTGFSSNNHKASSNRLSSTNYSQNTIEKSENIYYQMEGTKPNVKGIKNQVIRPVRMANKFRPTSPQPIRRESLELRLQKFGQKEQLQNNCEYIPSLKHSKSTVEEQESPYNSSEILGEKTDSNEQKSVQIKREIKPLKNSIKSLWDSVEKCAVSVICQNLQAPQPAMGQTGFNQVCQKTYNNLGRDSQFNSFVLSKWQLEEAEVSTTE